MDQTIVRQGQQAATLLEDQAFKTAIADVRADLFSRFNDTDIQDVEAMRMIKAEWNLLDELTNKLNGKVQRGKLEQSKKGK